MAAEPRVSDASRPAIIAASKRLASSRGIEFNGYTGYGEAILESAHNPDLGLDRSVCLRDVVERLRELAEEMDPNLKSQPARMIIAATLDNADLLAREFGGVENA